MRQAALQCVQSVVKLANRRALNRYWLSFLPEWHNDQAPARKEAAPPRKAGSGTGREELTVAPPLSSGQGGGMHSLLTSLERELVPQTRVCALQLMMSLFEGAKSFLMSAGVFVAETRTKPLASCLTPHAVSLLLQASGRSLMPHAPTS